MIGPKEKKERALGEHLNLKGTRCAGPKCAMVRKPYRPGMHGKSRPRPLSDFGLQLREKQKVKVSYGIDERNLKQIFERAKEYSGSTTTRLLELLESRLDNVVYRLGLASSRSMSRQLVAHGHILVNKKRVRSPGFVVQINDVVAIRSESILKKTFGTLKESLQKHDMPTWLTLDIEKLEGRMISAPEGTASPFEINLLVESFSK